MRLTTAPLLVVLAFAACGPPDETAPAETPTTAPTGGPRPVATTSPPAPAVGPAEPFVLVLLGDSFASGEDLPADAILAAQLERELEVKHVAVEILDEAAPGNAAAASARFGGEAEAEADALVIALGGDDLISGAAPATVESALADIIERAQARGAWVGLIGLKAPLSGAPSADAPYESAFNAVFGEVADAYSVELYPDYFSGLVDRETGETRPELFLPDGVHPTDLGVAVIAEGVADWLSDSLPREARERPGG